MHEDGDFPGAVAPGQWCHHNDIMVRTQIQLEEAQYRALKRWATQRGISLAEAVRRCVADKLDREAQTPTRQDRLRAALAVCGRHSDSSGSGQSVGADHDRELAKAFEH
jgi:hypothetical protein